MAMDRIEKTIEIDLPVETVYEQWTDFESFPEFMEGVKRVEPLGGKRMRWHAEIGGKDKAWEAIVTHEEPNRKIAWQSTSGAPNHGTVTFEDLGERARVRLLLEYEPEGAFEDIGSKIGAVSARVEGDLRRFRDFVEGKRRRKAARATGAASARRTRGSTAARRTAARPVRRQTTKR